MNLLWYGAEDIDFPNGITTIAANNPRPTYSRVGLESSVTGNGSAVSTLFPGGAVTSCWLHCWIQINSASGASLRHIGLVRSGATQGTGIWIGSGSTSSRLALFTYNGTTLTQLVMGSTDVIPSSTVQTYQLDLQVINFGASATLNLYVNGTLYCTYSGSVTVGGITNLDSVAIYGRQNNSFGASEFIVADGDTRSLSLATCAPNGNGTTQNWSNPAYTNFNPTAINDANSTFTNATGQDEQATLTDLPSGTFAVLGIKVAARAMATSGSTPTGVELGVNSSGTIGVGPSHTLTTAFTTYEDYFTNDPATGAPYLVSAINALQIDLRSA